MGRLWRMLAHLNGQTVNYSMLGNSLGVSNVTVRNYIDLLAATLMVHVLPPYTSNLGKRMVKAPRVYIADSGIACALLGVTSFQQLLGHPSLGAVWEQVVLSNLMGHFPKANFYFYRTSAGAEIDIVMEHQGMVVAIECKASVSPTLPRGAYWAMDDVRPAMLLIASPVSSGWPMRPGGEVVALAELPGRVKSCLLGQCPGSVEYKTKPHTSPGGGQLPPCP